jgi:hypothetical protein
MDIASTARAVEPTTHGEAVTEIGVVGSRRDLMQTLIVAATYRLSEDGRKLSLLAGGDGREIQQITLAVPTNRMHLVSVDADGCARLKLQPRYLRTGDQQVIRDDQPPRFDVLPTMDDLLKEAARNHQLERAYHTERADVQRQRQDRKFDVHQQIAEEFLAEPSRRAHEHPRPTPRQCFLTARNRIVFYDAKTDHGAARHVPSEAYRRYCADVNARKARNQDISRRESALHAERVRLIAEWVATRGTRDQRDRHAAGVLPIREVLDGLADEHFAAAGDRRRYVHDGLERLQALLRRFPPYAHVVMTPRDLQVTTEHAEDATEAQWALMQDLRALFPDAEVMLQRHRLAWAGDAKAPALTVWGVLVKRRRGPFVLLREYLAPAPDDVARDRADVDAASAAVFDKEPC